MGVGPATQLAEAARERRAVAAEVEVLHVQDLEARRLHLAFGVVGPRRGDAALGQPGQTARRRVAPALGVVDHVELERAQAAVELIGERRVPVLERADARRRAQLEQQREQRRVDRLLVAVVAAQHLQVVEAERLAPRRPTASAPTAEIATSATSPTSATSSAAFDLNRRSNSRPISTVRVSRPAPAAAGTRRAGARPRARSRAWCGPRDTAPRSGARPAARRA